MLNINIILSKTHERIAEMNPGDPSAALRSTQVQALASVLVAEINDELRALKAYVDRGRELRMM